MTLLPGVELLQTVSYVVAAFTLFVTIYWMVTHRNKWRYSIPMAALMFHNVLYYTFVFTYRAYHMVTDFPLFSTWSAILRLHSLITIMAIEVTRPGALIWVRKLYHLILMRVRG